MKYKAIEKKDKFAIHAICESKESAQRWININAVEYCAKGYFMDKTLTPDSFEVEKMDDKEYCKYKYRD